VRERESERREMFLSWREREAGTARPALSHSFKVLHPDSPSPKVEREIYVKRNFPPGEGSAKGLCRQSEIWIQFPF